ncbi:MAG: kelch repeat-containing protein [Candidatus Sulfotelmatobacter sp.]
MFMVRPASAESWNRYGPGTRTQATSIYDPTTDQMIMFGGQHAPTIVDFHDAWAVKNVIASSASASENLNWVALLPTGTPPSGRFGHTAVYNPTSNRMLVFGGGTGFPGPCVNDLWILQNPNSVGTPSWSELTPTGSLPPVREGHVVIYDSKANTMIVFGGTDCNGNYYNDLWILNNADGSTGTPKWTEAKPTGTLPAARSQSTATYDPVNRIVTIFGGTAGTTVYNDVWTLNSSSKIPSWKELTPTGTAPTARYAHTAIYDSTNNRMVIEGGITSKDVVLNDTWILTDANGVGADPAWTQLLPTDTAPYRGSHTAIYDPVSDEMVIFGGVSQIAQTFTDDHVFVLTEANGLKSGSTWSQDGPAPRFHLSGVYDAVTDQLIVFGGEQSATVGPFNDVWSEVSIAADELDDQPTTDWVQIVPSGTPPAARFGHTGVYDSASNRMIIFAGATNPTSCRNDLWSLDDANSADGTPSWISLTASGTPPPVRMNHIAVYDSTENTMIVFGGTNCDSGYLSDVWTLTNANGEGGTPTWKQLSPSGTGPGGRENMSSIYDSVNNILTIYAGDTGGQGLTDVWTLSNANGQGGTPVWTLLTPTGTAPEGRTGQSTVYDSVNNRMIMFGGINEINGTRFLDDTWILTSPNGLGGTPAWTAEKVSGTAPRRWYDVSFYSSVYNSLIVFGGESEIIPSPPDDHIFVLSEANGIK